MARILHISKFYHPYFGGIEDVARTLVDDMKPYHEQRIICFNHINETVDEVVDDIPVTRVGVMGTVASQPIAPHFHKHLKRIIKVFKPEYIHIHLPNPLSSISLQYIRGCNAKIMVHWHSDILGHTLFYPLYRHFEHQILKKAHTIFVTSEEYREHSAPLRKFRSKTTVLPNIVNEQKLQPQPQDEAMIARLREGWGNRKILLFVGRHVNYKGLHYLLEAEKLIKEDCVLLIGGEGPLTAELKRKAEGRHRVFFLGRLSNDELRCYMHAASVFVFPSYMKSEAFGVALAEALYCGLPAVSFNIEGSGVNWVNVDQETGFVVPCGDVKRFAEAVDMLLADDALRTRMGYRAIEWVQQNFLKSNISTALTKVYGRGEPMVKSRKEGKLNVSIVLYKNDFESVRRLVNILHQAPDVRDIFLIDNSPKRDERYRTLDVIYRFNDINLGYGKGHNEAFYYTFREHVPYHLAINADVHFEPSVIAELVKAMDHDDRIGALMPKVYYPNGSLQHLCRLLPTPLDLFGRRFLPDRWMSKRVARLELRHTSYSHPLAIPHISGCFMMVRADSLRHTGLFDPRFFLYMEDVDLTRRLHQSYQTLFYPAVTITHEHERGSYKLGHLLGVHIVSAVKYFNKWGWWHDAERERVNEATLWASRHLEDNSAE